MKEEQKQVMEGGHATFSVKVPQFIYDLVNILCEGLQHGTNGNDMMKMFIQTFIESAKHDGPPSPEMKMFLNMLKLDPSWHKAFNFADATAQTEVAQVILVLQQKDRKGFGLAMIDKPFMGEAQMTYCVDDILERVAEVSMKGLYRQLRQVGVAIESQSLRETLMHLCNGAIIEHLNELDREEMPGYGEHHDYGRAIEYGKKYLRKQHRTPDSLANSQQRIVFEDIDRDTATSEAEDWEGEHRQYEQPPTDIVND